MEIFKRLINEDDGMEMIEWAIVGVVFAVVAAGAWTALAGSVQTAITAVADEVTPTP